MFSITDIVLAPLNGLINTTLRLDPENFEKLIPLAGKVLAIEWRSFAATLYIFIQADGLRLSFRHTGDPDTLLSANTPLAFARLLAQPDIKGPTSELIIQGDPHLAQEIQTILSSLSIDWEEHLSKFLGDGPAFHIGKIAEHTHNWVKETQQNMQLNTKEFLQQETDLLPARRAIEDFLQDVDNLRNDVERAAVRIKQLEKVIGK